MAYSLTRLINPELESKLSFSQRDFIERAVAEFFDHLKEEITIAISELQALDHDISTNPDYEISKPDQFTYHQYKLIKPVMISFLEHLEKELRGSDDDDDDSDVEEEE